jgi:hypothetical protein
MLFSLLRDKYENAASFASIPKQAYRGIWADEAAHIQSLYERLSVALGWPGQDKNVGLIRRRGTHFKDASLATRCDAATGLVNTQNTMSPNKTISAILQQRN